MARRNITNYSANYKCKTLAKLKFSVSGSRKLLWYFLAGQGRHSHSRSRSIVNKLFM